MRISTRLWVRRMSSWVRARLKSYNVVQCMQTLAVNLNLSYRLRETSQRRKMPRMFLSYQADCPSTARCPGLPLRSTDTPS